MPYFTSPEEAVHALVHAVRHARRRAAPLDPPPELPGLDADRAAAIVAEALGAGGGWLDPAAAEALLRSFGIPLAAGLVVASPQDAGRAAVRLGAPVAVKVVAAGLVHRSDVGAVRLGLSGAAPVERAAREIAAAVEAAGHAIDGYLVQAMAPAGPELLLGVLGDPAFGPLVAIGAGGTTTELIRDLQVRLAPIGRSEAAEMLRALARSGCSTAIAAVRAPMCWRSRTSCCASRRSPPPIRRSLSSTATPSSPAHRARSWSTRVRIGPPPPPHRYGTVDI